MDRIHRPSQAPGRSAPHVRDRKLRFETLEVRRLLAVSVVPSIETVAASGADDVAIWIHPTDTSKSVIIGTAKTSANSVRVYSLSGTQLQTVSSAEVNNIDLRYNFRLGAQTAAIVAGSDRSNNSITLFRVDPQSGLLTNVAARTISTGIAIYGCSMYLSPVSGKYYTFVTSESGQVQQWELFDNGGGKVDAKLVRSFSVGSRSEGMVADDKLGYLYVSEEDVGIWRYSAEPDGGTARTKIDLTGSGGHLTADVEGLTIYYAANGAGYLLASSQGSNEFEVYQRAAPNSYVGSLKLVAGGGIDAVTDTDGIDVTNFPLGSQFPQGLFVAQDNDENFKLARWDAIASAFGNLPNTNTTWDPRLVGAHLGPALPGDYNLNGRVDAADYTLWRDTMGSTVQTFAGADGNGNGRIDADDYDVWKTNFGRSLTNTAAGTLDIGLANSTTVSTFNARPEQRGRQQFTQKSAVVGALDAALLAWPTARAASQPVGSEPGTHLPFRSEPDATDQVSNSLGIAFASVSLIHWRKL
jgi:3-phytase